MSAAREHPLAVGQLIHDLEVLPTLSFYRDLGVDRLEEERKRSGRVYGGRPACKSSEAVDRILCSVLGEITRPSGPLGGQGFLENEKKGIEFLVRNTEYNSACGLLVGRSEAIKVRSNGLLGGFLEE